MASVRRFVFIMLLVMLPWQAIASTIGTLAHEAENALVHISDHELGVTHHHHDDGTVSYDDTDDSRKHLSHYAGVNGAAILTNLAIAFAVPSTGAAPPEFSPPFPSGPFLEGLRRPPRALG